MPKVCFLPLYSSLIFIIGTISFSGCNKQNNMQISSPEPQDSSGFKYLALGDSYTIGQGVLAEERYPYLVAAALRSEGIVIKDPEYIATTGWTTANLQSAINRQNPGNDYAFVTLLIGVNDQYQHVDTSVYRIRFTELLNKSVSLAGNDKARVIVLSIPDYSATPFVAPANKERVSREINYFNTINQQVTLGNNITYIDITSLTKEVVNDSTLLTDDQLHYSRKEYQKWADLMVPLMKKVLH